MNYRMRMKILLIDNYDSFTYNLKDYLLQLGAEVRVERNDTLPLEDYFELSCDAIVLSPGPQRPENAGHLMRILAYYHDKKPILGICLGHQALGLYFGAIVKRASLPVHGKTSTLNHRGHQLFVGLPATFEVMRYHSLVVENLEKTPLKVIATTTQGEVMAFSHATFPIIGLQFHPESILTEFGLEMMKNWMDAIKGKANSQ